MSKPHLIRYSPKTLLLTIIVAKFKVKPFLIKNAKKSSGRDFLAKRLLHFVQLTSFSVWNFACSKNDRRRFTLRHLSRIFVDDATRLWSILWRGWFSNGPCRRKPMISGHEDFFFIAEEKFTCIIFLADLWHTHTKDWWMVFNVKYQKKKAKKTTTQLSIGVQKSKWYIITLLLLLGWQTASGGTKFLLQILVNRGWNSTRILIEDLLLIQSSEFSHPFSNFCQPANRQSSLCLGLPKKWWDSTAFSAQVSPWKTLYMMIKCVAIENDRSIIFVKNVE